MISSTSTFQCASSLSSSTNRLMHLTRPNHGDTLGRECVGPARLDHAASPASSARVHGHVAAPRPEQDSSALLRQSCSSPVAGRPRAGVPAAANLERRQLEARSSIGRRLVEGPRLAPLPGTPRARGALHTPPPGLPEESRRRARKATGGAAWPPELCVFRLQDGRAGRAVERTVEIPSRPKGIGTAGA